MSFFLMKRLVCLLDKCVGMRACAGPLHDLAHRDLQWSRHIGLV